MFYFVNSNIVVRHIVSYIMSYNIYLAIIYIYIYINNTYLYKKTHI